MAFDIISVSPTVTAAAHAAGDVMFNLTSIKLPARKCKLINVFATVASGGGEDDTKIGLLFFQKNDTVGLKTDSALNETADISSANFVANDFIGASFLQLSSGTGVDLDVIDNVALYYGGAFGTSSNNARVAPFDPVKAIGLSPFLDLLLHPAKLAAFASSPAPKDLREPTW